MESEEYEHVPWSNLVAEAKAPVDKRLYLVAGGVGLIVVMIFGMRMFGSAHPVPATSDPVAPATQLVEEPPGEVPVTDAAVTPTMTVTEADLLAFGPADTIDRGRVAEFIAEWFVTDFYTRDGSPETIASLSSLASESIATELPHHDTESADAFVEWARAFRVLETGDVVEVDVAYRTIHAVDAGYIRDPVEAVRIALTDRTGGWSVEALPAIIDLP